MIRYIAIAVMIVVGIQGMALATVPRLMSFQGKLTNNADQPLTGNQNFTFRIYGVATDRPSSPSASVLISGRDKAMV